MVLSSHQLNPEFMTVDEIQGKESKLCRARDTDADNQEAVDAMQAKVLVRY